MGARLQLMPPVDPRFEHARRGAPKWVDKEHDERVRREGRIERRADLDRAVGTHHLQAILASAVEGLLHEKLEDYRRRRWVDEEDRL
eukprot:856211-Prymnesium_polylepis.1